MSNVPLLDWATMAVSLVNTILLFWLGLTVLLNARRRSWGIWLSGSGMLLGGAFFTSHSIILGQGLDNTDDKMTIWWWAGWFPVIALPLAWYLVILWYSGFWERPANHPQKPWFYLVCLLAALLVTLLLFDNPLPTYTQVAQLNLSPTLTILGLPLLAIVYPVFIILCIGLSLLALLQTAPNSPTMGDVARTRAKPWLLATTLVLLLVSLIVSWVLIWVVLSARERNLYNIYNSMGTIIAWVDLAISSLVGIAIALLGQAIVSYEIFTGKTLPRQGFQRQWQSVVFLATVFGVLVSASLSLRLSPVYSLVLATLLLAFTYAFFSWRSYTERERYIQNLRPFVASQRLYENLLAVSANTNPVADIRTPFYALCRQVLGTQRAYLVALGPLSPLAGPALSYPAESPVALPSLVEIAGQFTSPHQTYLQLEPEFSGNLSWAVPLWSERGLIGVMLLGEKTSGGIYTQEEIEIARASGERLIDTLAGAEMARRLMLLQRQRMAESQVLDRRVRRVLHDDILPLLHTAILSISATRPGPEDEIATREGLGQLAEVHRRVSTLLREAPAATNTEVTRAGLLAALQEIPAQELKNSFDEVNWEISPEATAGAQTLSPIQAEVLYFAAREAIRNAARYGQGNDHRPLRLTVKIDCRDQLEIQIEDNGIGLAGKAISSGGSGQGLALHSTLMAVIGGTLLLESVPGQYTRVRLTLPLENQVALPAVQTGPGF